MFNTWMFSQGHTRGDLDSLSGASGGDIETVNEELGRRHPMDSVAHEHTAILVRAHIEVATPARWNLC